MTKTQIQTVIPLYERMLQFTGPTDSRYIRSYDSVIGTAQSSYCFYIPYQRWRGWRDFGAIPSGQPQYHTIRPNETLEIYPISNTNNSNASTYVLAFDYLTTFDVLTTNTSIPIFPTEWHEAIVWGTVAYWGKSRGDAVKSQIGTREFERVKNQLLRSQMPEPLLNLSAYYGD